MAWGISGSSMFLDIFYFLHYDKSMTNHFFSNTDFNDLTDSELLQTELATDDPRREITLEGKIADNISLEKIIKTYDFRDEKLPCSIPGCNARHHRGFLVQAGKEKILVGCDCGKKYFGETWDLQKKKINHAKTRQNYLKIKYKILEYLTPENFKNLRMLRVHCDAIDKSLRDFKLFAPSIFEQIRKNIEHGKKYIFIEKRINEKSKQYSETVNHRKNLSPDFEEVVVHNIRWNGAFIINFRKDLEFNINLIQTCHDVISGNELPLTSMQKSVRDFREGANGLVALYQRAILAQNFFLQFNLNGISNWSLQAKSKDGFIIHGQKMIKIRRDIDDCLIELDIPKFKKINSEIIDGMDEIVLSF